MVEAKAAPAADKFRPSEAENVMILQYLGDDAVVDQ